MANRIIKEPLKPEELDTLVREAASDLLKIAVEKSFDIDLLKSRLYTTDASQNEIADSIIRILGTNATFNIENKQTKRGVTRIEFSCDLVINKEIPPKPESDKYK